MAAALAAATDVETARVAAIAERWIFAHLALSNALGHVRLEQLGAWLAAKLPDWPDDPRAVAARVHRIETAQTEPGTAVVAAFAEILRERADLAVDPGWITYGAASRAPAPELPTAHGHGRRAV